MSAPGVNASRDDADVLVTPQIAAEAAVWIAKLHGPGRSRKMERDFLEWQARSAAHRKAFERSTDIWEAVPRVRLQDAYASASLRASAAAADVSGGGAEWTGRRRRGLLLWVLPVLVAAAALAFRFSSGGESYVTQVGGQQLIVLDDGSRMTLNTDTRVRVKFAADRRSIDVEQGEALFEVAKDPHRPFLVHAGGSEVVAVGTVFSVRLGEGGDHLVNALAVTLVEGHVSVRPDPSAWTSGLSPASPVLMNAGERFELTKATTGTDEHAVQKLDKPRIDQLLAWEHNEAVFDDVPLPDAVAEMNRYSRTPIILSSDAALARLRVSGQYHTGDNISFAKAVSTLHGLTFQEREGRLELSLPH